MANSKSKAISPMQFPSLQPWEYLHKAVNNGFTQEQAKVLSGFNRGTWHNWLYRRSSDPRKTKKISPPFTEKLYRVAEYMGWLSEDVAA